MQHISLHNILCFDFCKQITANSKFFAFLFLILFSYECGAQNLNMKSTVQNQSKNEHLSEVRNLQVINEKAQITQFLEDEPNHQQDPHSAVIKEKGDLTLPRDYNYFLYYAEPYVAGADTRVRRAPFIRKKPTRPYIHQHIYKPRPTTAKKAWKEDDEEDDEIVENEQNVYDEEKGEEDEDGEANEDNDDYDDQGKDCDTTKRCKVTKPCKAKVTCETTEPCETTAPCKTTDPCETTTEECTEPPTECDEEPTPPCEEE